MVRPNVCERCRRHKCGPGAFCQECLSFYRRRHAAWAQHRGAPVADDNEPARPEAIPRPLVCLDVDGAHTYTPSFNVRLRWGFLMLAMKGDL